MKRLIVALMSAALVACATPTDPQYRPIVDTQGMDHNAFERDLAECKQFATQQMDAAQGAAAGAVAGALFGAAIGAVLGLRGNDLAQVAGVGAVTWGTAGAGGAQRSQADIVKNCLAGRGYRVLG